MIVLKLSCAKYMGRMMFILTRQYFHGGDNTFTQKILDKEGLNNSQVHLQNERGFLKYNYNL